MCLRHRRAGNDDQRRPALLAWRGFCFALITMNTSTMLSCSLLVVCAAGFAGCQRESRTFHPDAPFPHHTDFSESEKNAYNLSQGKQLYQAFNCNGCHGGGGGGGMGPPLIDDRWLYGFQPQDIYRTISE